MKKLIIDADDFGLSPGVNEGIIRAIEYGVVTSTGVLINGPCSKDAGWLRAKFPNISVGIHLDLSGVPGTKVLRKIRAEFDRQVWKFVETLGFVPDYYNSHRNTLVYPHVFLAGLMVAKKWGIRRMRSYNRYLVINGRRERFPKVLVYYASHPGRMLTHSTARLLTWYANLKEIKTPDRLITPGYLDRSKKNSLETWLSIIESLPEGVNEIYCHPGYPDEILSQYATYVKEREIEVEVLTSTELKEAIKRNGIQLISFKDLL